MSVPDFVTDFPVAESWKIVEKALGGDLGTDVRMTARTLLACASFGLGQVLPQDVVKLKGMKTTLRDGGAEARAAIHALANGTMMAEAGVFPWLSIVQLILQILEGLGK